MSASVEASRRHGRFDLRWPTRPLRAASDWPAPVLVDLGDVPDGLDWNDFSARYFPGRRRHDLEAIGAYDAYTPGRWRKKQAPLPSRRIIGLNETIRPQGRRSGGEYEDLVKARIIDPTMVMVTRSALQNAASIRKEHPHDRGGRDPAPAIQRGPGNGAFRLLSQVLPLSRPRQSEARPPCPGRPPRRRRRLRRHPMARMAA
jgi:hypothetical protein